MCGRNDGRSERTKPAVGMDDNGQLRPVRLICPMGREYRLFKFQFEIPVTGVTVALVSGRPDAGYDVIGVRGYIIRLSPDLSERTYERR